MSLSSTLLIIILLAMIVISILSIVGTYKTLKELEETIEFINKTEKKQMDIMMILIKSKTNKEEFPETVNKIIEVLVPISQNETNTINLHKN